MLTSWSLLSQSSARCYSQSLWLVAWPALNCQSSRSCGQQHFWGQLSSLSFCFTGDRYLDNYLSPSSYHLSLASVIATQSIPSSDVTCSEQIALRQIWTFSLFPSRIANHLYVTSLLPWFLYQARIASPHCNLVVLTVYWSTTADAFQAQLPSLVAASNAFRTWQNTELQWILSFQAFDCTPPTVSLCVQLLGKSWHPPIS